MTTKVFVKCPYCGQEKCLISPSPWQVTTNCKNKQCRKSIDIRACAIK